MTVPTSHHRAGSVLRCVLVLVAVLVSSLCAAGQSAAEPVRAEPASAAADVRPAAGPLAGRTAAEQGSLDVVEAVAFHETADSASSGRGHCGKQATPDAASTHDGSRPSAPLPAPEREQLIRFFAAGIVAENPQRFGLKKDQPLSALYKVTQ